MTVFQKATRLHNRILVNRFHSSVFKYILKKLRAKSYGIIAKTLSPFSSDAAAYYIHRSREFEDLKLILLYDKLKGKVPYDPHKPCVLIVCENADHCENTSLALDIIRKLSETYNTTCLLLRGGEAQTSFLTVSETVLNTNSRSSHPLTYKKVIKEICEARDFSYALVVSLEPHAVLRELRRNCVASVLLINSETSISHYEAELRNAIRWTDECMFLTSSSMKKALSSQFNTIDFAQRVELFGKGRLAISGRNDGRANKHNTVKLRLDKQGYDAFELDEVCFAIEALGQAAHQRFRSRTSDIEEIKNSGRFRSDFFLPFRERSRSLTEHAAIAQYIDHQKSSNLVRKPEPGFNPFIYSNENMKTYDYTRDAYADFLSKGMPEGPWLLPVLEGSTNSYRNQHCANLRVALHIHSFFVDGISDLVARLDLNKTTPDIYVSVRNQYDREAVYQEFRNYRGVLRDVAVTPNRGRDNGPFLTLFGPELHSSYDVIGHMHLKRSSHKKRIDVVRWQNFLSENLIGGNVGGPMLDAIIREFANDPEVGVVYASDPRAAAWGLNLEFAQELARRMGHYQLPRSFNFPLGTMFWMRAGALDSFINLKLSWADYPQEPVANDGTMLHALERLYGVIPQLESWKTVVTNVPGISR